eukprot:TRINITY_DN22181_c0_g1_i1.p1 TRINITY_DN22181_c0_g1~~TRINITY_DN22181_c0_g1_i1.p1  ORF type:complete len:627 (-),score=122.77 TRINITY_DN22181_c0_g1_i1:420-2258(-)
MATAMVKIESPRGTYSPRPQSYRYLRDTLGKLGVDAERSLERQTGVAEAPPLKTAVGLPAADGRPLTGRDTTAGTVGVGSLSANWSPSVSKTASETDSRPPTMSGNKPYNQRAVVGVAHPADVATVDINLWRSAFQAEASQCVRSMEAVVESARVGTFASRFEEWRKADLKATAQAQQHVKELARLNIALEEFLTSTATPEEFGTFRESMVRLREVAVDLNTARHDIEEGMDAAAERGAKRVMKNWEADVRTSAQLWRDLQGLQQNRWSIDDERWAQIDARLEQVQSCMDQLCQDVRGQTTQMEDLNRCHTRTAETVSNAVQVTTAEAGRETKAMTEHVSQKLQENLAEDVEALRRHMSTLLGAVDLQQVPVSQLLRRIDDKLEDLEASCRKETKHHREAAEKLQNNLFDARADIAKLRSEREDSARQVSALNERCAKSQKDFADVEQSLSVATKVSLSNAMRQIKEIERRGNLRLNRQTGDVKLLKQVEFTPNQANKEPTAEFKDPEAAASTLSDIVELARFFDFPVGVEASVLPARGPAKPEYWTQMAQNRASLIKSWMQEQGAEPELVNVVGRVAEGKGATAGIVIRLDKDVFPGEVVKEKAGRSPGRK